MMPSTTSRQDDEEPGETWNLRYRELLAYRKQHGHCVVPQRYQDNVWLGRWVSQQRAYYRLIKKGHKSRSRLWDFKVRLLEQVGFVWYVGVNQREEVIAQVQDTGHKKQQVAKKRPSARLRALRKKKIAEEQYKAVVINKKRRPSTAAASQRPPVQKKQKTKTVVSKSSSLSSISQKKKVAPAAEFCVTPESSKVHDSDSDFESESEWTLESSSHSTELNDHDLELARLIATFPSHSKANPESAPQCDYLEMHEHLDTIDSLQDEIFQLQQELRTLKSTTAKVQNQVMALLLGSASFDIHPTADGSSEAIPLIE